MEVINRYASIAWERRVSPEISERLSSEGTEASVLAATLRQEGLPVQAYLLADEAQVADLPFPFLTAVNQQWVMGVPHEGGVSELASESGVTCLDSLPPNPVLVAEPPVNAAFMVQEHVARDARSKPDEVAVFYTHTNSDADLAKEQLLDDLESLIATARDQGREILFIDSLGLIPSETVRMLGGDRKGFLTALGHLRLELARMKSGGGPTRDLRHPVWDSAYKLLHKHGIDMVLENLAFDLWKESVSFDQTRLAQKALAHFTAHQLESAAKSMAAYQEEFHRINCTTRNANFVQQIEQLATQRTQPVLVLILREIGHFGVLERHLAARGFAMRSKILGRDRFTTLLKISGMEQTLDNIGVSLAPEEKRAMALRECLKHLVLQKAVTGSRLPEVMKRLSEFQIDRLGWEKIDDLIGQLHEPTRVYLRGHPHNQTIQDQLLYMLKDECIVPEAWVPDPADGIPAGGEKHVTSKEG